VPYINHLDWETYLAALTTPGRQVTFRDGRAAVLEFVNAGQLRLTSGRVSVLDPTCSHDPEVDSDMVFVTIPPGSYPVEMISAVLDFQGRRIARGAAIRMQLAERRATSWSPAVGDSLAQAGSFGVDAGVGAIMDAHHLHLLNDPAFTRLLEETVLAGDLLVGHPPTGDHDALAFDCGMGDGAYPVLLGHDDAGNLADILVDLELCSWSPEWADISNGTTS
jgi:hypothetical protein